MATYVHNKRLDKLQFRFRVHFCAFFPPIFFGRNSLFVSYPVNRAIHFLWTCHLSFKKISLIVYFSWVVEMSPYLPGLDHWCMLNIEICPLTQPLLHYWIRIRHCLATQISWRILKKKISARQIFWGQIHEQRIDGLLIVNIWSAILPSPDFFSSSHPDKAQIPRNWCRKRQVIFMQRMMFFTRTQKSLHPPKYGSRGDENAINQALIWTTMSIVMSLGS